MSGSKWQDTQSARPKNNLNPVSARASSKMPGAGLFKLRIQVWMSSKSWVTMSFPGAAVSAASRASSSVWGGMILNSGGRFPPAVPNAPLACITRS